MHIEHCTSCTVLQISGLSNSDFSWDFFFHANSFDCIFNAIQYQSKKFRWLTICLSWQFDGFVVCDRQWNEIPTHRSITFDLWIKPTAYNGRTIEYWECPVRNLNKKARPDSPIVRAFDSNKSKKTVCTQIHWVVQFAQQCQFTFEIFIRNAVSIAHCTSK